VCAIDSADDLPEFMIEHYHIAKKSHYCSECSRIIEPKERYYKAVGKWDGDLKTFKHCTHCMIAAKLLQRECNGYIFTEICSDINEHIGYKYPWERDARRLSAGMLRQWKFFNGKLMNIPVLKTTD